MNFVITGASSGIGRATAMILSSDHNNKIFAISRNREKLNELASAATNIIPVVCDISDEKELSKATEQIKSVISSIEVVIHNAGKLIYKGFEELEQADWLNIYETNVFGPVFLTKALLPLIKKGRLHTGDFNSHIVMISSVGGVTGTQKFAGLSAYSSSKGAFTVLSECLAEEFRQSAIAVNCLALGSVETEMFRAAFPGLKAGSTSEDMARYIAEFAINGPVLFNGKTIQVSLSTP